MTSLQRACIAAACVLCSAGVMCAQVRDPLPVPDVGAFQTLKCDFHMHTVFSDGDVWPATRIQEAWRDGLDAVAISDHADYHPHKADVSTDLTRPFAVARAAAEQAGIILIPAVEVSEGDLHANALFVKDPNAFPGLKLAEALRRAREQDAFVFWNHPGWKQIAEWFPPIAAAHSEKLIQGIELVNGSTFYQEAFPWVSEKSLAILANSDVHRALLPEYGQRPVTLVFVRQADSDGIREALFARRSAAWMNGEVWGPEALLAGLWEGAVKLEPAEISAGGARRSAALAIHNGSAIPFRVRVSKAPAWLRLRVSDLRERKITGCGVEITKAAPSGRTTAQVELEITNLHVESGRNLTVKVPVAVNVTP